MANTKRSSKAEATRQHILDTGFQLVAHKGFSGVGLQEILKTAGVPKGSFYHYFSSKEGFGTALLASYNESYMERLEHLLDQQGTGRERLMRYWSAWIEDPDQPTAAGWAENCLVVKLSAEVADLSEDMRRVLTRGVEGLIARLAELIETGQQDGSITQEMSADTLAHMLYQMWLGSALLAKLERTDAPMRRAVDATKILLN